MLPVLMYLMCKDGFRMFDETTDRNLAIQGNQYHGLFVDKS